MKPVLCHSVLVSILLATAGTTHAQMIAKQIQWRLDGARYSGYLVYNDASDAKRPGLLMIPNWYGVNADAVKAKMIAGSKYVIPLGDMYGHGIRPADATQALAVVKPRYADRTEMRGNHADWQFLVLGNAVHCFTEVR